MGIYEFNLLSIDEKVNFTWQNASFIESVRHGEKGYALYYVKEFYIEMELDKQQEAIISITAFKQGVRLEKYLEFVKLEKLF